MTTSTLENELEFQLKAVGLRPEREFRFAPPRRWRADFAFERERVLVECEGGHWVQGRHNRGKGFERDMEKYNAAGLDGWLVLRYSGRMIRSGQALREIQTAVTTRVPF